MAITSCFMPALARCSVEVRASVVYERISTKHKSRVSFAVRKYATHLQFRTARHHLLEPDADALDNGKQHGAPDGSVPRRLEAAPYRERPSGQEPGPDRVPRVLLVPQALDRAVEGAEEAAPDAEVAAQHGGAHLDRREGADPPFAVGAVAEAFYAVPYCAAYRLGGGSVGVRPGGMWCWEEEGRGEGGTYAHGERATKVIEDYPRAWVSCVVERHLVCSLESRWTPSVDGQW